jgi:prolyl 4-hydroxylase
MKIRRLIVILLILILFLLVIYNSINIKREPFARNYVDMPNYNIQEISNFLTNEECDKIIQLSNGKMFPSKIYSTREDILSSESRISNQCWINDSDPIIKNISEKIKKYTNTDNKFYEELQVVNYKKGGFFKPHYDPCEGNENECSRMNGSNGPRYLTILFYLNDGFKGGETLFPHINKSVKPEKGKAVIFQNVDKNGVIIKQALHGGQPVIDGEKWIANKWVHLY